MKPIPNAKSVRSFTYERSGGRTFATIFEPKSDANGTAILFCHGTGNDRFYPQRDLFETLLKSGCSIFTFDLDGHGKESSTRLDVRSINSCVNDAIKQCLAHLKPKKLVLVGHSLGASLAIGAEKNKAVSAIIAISPPIAPSLSNGTILSEARGIFKFHALKQIFNYGLFGSLPSAGTFKRTALPIRLNDQKIVEKGFYYLPVIREIIENQNVPKLLSQPSKPRLILTGSLDLVAPARHVEKYLPVKGRDQYHCLVGENHVSLIFSRTCLKLISDFVKELNHEPGRKEGKSSRSKKKGLPPTKRKIQKNSKTKSRASKSTKGTRKKR